MDVSTNQEFENMITCRICLNTLVIPVNIKFPCTLADDPSLVLSRCDYNICLHCARSYLDLNRPKSKRKQSVECLMCRQTTLCPQNLNASNAYTKNMTLMRILDSLKREWTCQNTYKEHRCTYTTSSQFDLARHEIDVCPYAVVQCRWTGCKQYDIRVRLKDHEMVCEHGVFACNVCHEDVRVTDLPKHYAEHQQQMKLLKQYYKTLYKK